MSLKDFYAAEYALNKFTNCGILGSYLDHFSDWLSEKEYQKETARSHITNVAHFSYYLIDKSLSDIHTLNEYIEEFLHDHISNCKCTGWCQVRNRNKVSSAINNFKKFLFYCYEINFDTNPSVYPKIQKEYQHWLTEKRGLNKHVVKCRTGQIEKFFRWYSIKNNKEDIEKITAHDIENFFMEKTKGYSISHKKSILSTMRNFCDFCYEQGYTSNNLRPLLPCIQTYKLSKAPRKIEEDEVEKLLKSIDRTKPGGIRDYAILQLLSTYGVRGGQIAALKLTDINWQKEEIFFPPIKGGKGVLVPLTSGAGNALLDYLQKVRKKSSYQEVFLMLHAPYSSMNISTISSTVRHAMITSGIKSPTKGTHCFRHAFVAQMLNKGNSFKHIADLIGHRHLQSTFIYTKIDFRSLSEVPLELPEVDNENI